MNNMPLSTKEKDWNKPCLKDEAGRLGVQKTKQAKLENLKLSLAQPLINTASFIGKATYRGRQLGVSKASIILLLEQHFTDLGYDLGPLKIRRNVNGCYRWAQEKEELAHDN